MIPADPAVRARRLRCAASVIAALLAALSLAPLPAQVAGSTATPAPGAEAAAAPEPEATADSAADELSKRATDPTVSPMTFSLIADFTTASYDLPGGVSREDATVLKFQPVLPFKAWGVANILRMTLPYELSGPGNGGLGDVTFFDMAVFGRSWGRLGVGVVASFASSASNPPSHASAGPAIALRRTGQQEAQSLSVQSEPLRQRHRHLAAPADRRLPARPRLVALPRRPAVRL